MFCFLGQEVQPEGFLRLLPGPDLGARQVSCNHFPVLAFGLVIATALTNEPMGTERVYKDDGNSGLEGKWTNANSLVGQKDQWDHSTNRAQDQWERTNRNVKPQTNLAVCKTTNKQLYRAGKGSRIRLPNSNRRISSANFLILNYFG